MSYDLKDQIREVADFIYESQTPIRGSDVRAGTVGLLSGVDDVSRPLKKVLIVVAAFVLVLIVLGGVAWLAPFGGGTSPVDEINVSTTVIGGAGDESLLQFFLSDMPPFRATVTYDRNPEGLVETDLFYPYVPQGATAVVEVSYDPPDRFRLEMVAMDPVGPDDGGSSAGSYIVSNSGTSAHYQAVRDELFALPMWDSPLGAVFWNSDWPNWDRRCASGDHEFLSDEVIAGRNALHLTCSDLNGDWEFWVDAETGVVLKLTGVVLGNPMEPGTSPSGGFEVTSIEYGAVFAEDVFATPASTPQGTRTSQVPPFHATLKTTALAEQVSMAYDNVDISDDPFFIQEIWYAGSDGWRANFLETDLPSDVAWPLDAGSFPGDFVVWNGSERVEYYGSTNHYSRSPREISVPERVLWLMAPPSPDWLSRSCSPAADDTFLGRSTLRYACTDGTEQIEGWIDEATGLVLKWSITGGPVAVDMAERPHLDFELLSLELDPTFAPSTFEFTPPPDAVDVADIPFDKWSLFGFDQGDVVPTWTGPLISDDGTFTLEDVQGRPALVLLWASWDDSGLTAISEFAALSDIWSTDVAFVSVSIWDEPKATRNVINRGEFTSFPTVSCLLDDGNLCSPGYVSELWGFNAWLPVGWVLLDEGGRAVDVFVAESTLDEISAALAAVTGS
jgi:hypothetical protein